MKMLAVNFADWMIVNECYAPLTAGNVPLWFGNGIDGKTSEELYQLFLDAERERLKTLNKADVSSQVCQHEFCESPAGFSRCIKCKKYDEC